MWRTQPRPCHVHHHSEPMTGWTPGQVPMTGASPPPLPLLLTPHYHQVHSKRKLATQLPPHPETATNDDDGTVATSTTTGKCHQQPSEMADSPTSLTSNVSWTPSEDENNDGGAFLTI